MIGCYDFCGHYEWTFEWLRQHGGENLVSQFWEEAIGGNSQSHAADLVKEKGFAGMAEYWAHTLAEEGAGYVATKSPQVFRIDMHECPSKGFLIRNRLEQYHDYCDHCIGWIGPMMSDAGFKVHHEHNHCGKCWWEFRKSSDPTAASETGVLAREDDVRLHADWSSQDKPKDKFETPSSQASTSFPAPAGSTETRRRPPRE